MAVYSGASTVYVTTSQSGPAPLVSLSVWTDVEAAGGTREGDFVDWIVASDDERLGNDGRLGEETMTAQVAMSGAAWDDAQEGKALRTVLADGEIREWRIVKLRRKRDEGGGLTGVIECESIAYDLFKRTPLIQRVESNRADVDFKILNLTPTEWIDDVILQTPDWPSWVVRGTVEATDDVSYFLGGKTAGELLDAIAEITEHEWTLTRNGGTDWRIDLVSQRGSSSETPFWAHQKNLISSTYSTNATEQATRIYPRGGGPETNRAHIGTAQWSVDSVSSGVVTLSDPAGGDGPVAYDDQFGGYSDTSVIPNRYLEKADGSLTEITDSDAANDTVTVADDTSISPGDLVHIRANSSGDQLIYLEHPADKNTYGLQVRRLNRQDIPDVVNLVSDVASAFLDEDTDADGLADGWNKVGTPTTTIETGAEFHKHGTASQKVVAANGEGIVTDAITVDPVADDPFFVAQFVTRVASGTLQIQLLDVTNGNNYPGDSDTAGQRSEQGILSQHQVQPGVNFSDASTTSMKLRIVARGGAATFYVDAAQLVQSEAGAQTLFEGRGANLLWQAGNNELSRRSSPERTIDTRALDMYRIDTGRWPHDKVQLGQSVRIKDDDLGIDETVRVVRRRRTLTEEGAIEVTLDRQRRRLSREIPRQNLPQLADSAPPQSHADQTEGTNLDRLLGLLDGANIKTGSIDANKLTVTELSAIAADVGELIAGTIQDVSGTGWKFRINLGTPVIEVRDGSSTTRVKVGDVTGGGVWGIRVWDSGSNLLMDETGGGEYQNQPTIESWGAGVGDDGSNEDYESSWTPGQHMTDADHTVKVDYIKNGSTQATSTVSSPVTTTTDTATSTGTGGTQGEQHKVRIRLIRDSDSQTIYNDSTVVFEQDTSGGGGFDLEPH